MVRKNGSMAFCLCLAITIPKIVYAGGSYDNSLGTTFTGSLNFNTESNLTTGYDLITNEGTITGDINGGANPSGNGGYNQVTNSGTVGDSIYGRINSGSNSSGGSNAVTNTGSVGNSIFGSDNTGSGSSGGGNIITSSGPVGGLIYGSYNGGAGSSGGANVIHNSSTLNIGDIVGSYNNNTGSSGGSNIIVNSGTITGNGNGNGIVGSWNFNYNNTSGGSNTIINSGEVGNIVGSDNWGPYGGGGANTIITSGTVGMLMGSWNSTTNNYGGSNSIINSGTVQTSICGSSNTGTNSSGGLNTIINSGTVNGAGFTGYFGFSDPFGVTTSAVFGSYNSGTGSSGGSNIINNSGIINASIYGSYNSGISSNGGSNTITNTGVVNGSIYGSYNSGTGSSGGSNIITNTGMVNGNIYGGGSNSIVNWTGGTLNGSIEMSGANNAVNVTGVPAANLSQVYHLQGDVNNSGQVLTYSDIQYKGGTFASDNLSMGINLLNWDTINFTNNTQWTLTSGLTLKDATVNIDATSTLYAGNGVMPVISAPTTPVTVNNAGTIDLTNGGSTAANKLTIVGYYIGENGILKVDTVLGPGPAHSDELVIDGSHGGGSATGTTRILVNSIGTTAATTGDGVRIVNAINGATTDSGAFILVRPVIDGAYSTAMFQGGPYATDAYGDSSTNNYYLRRTTTLSGAAQLSSAYPSTLLNLDMETLGTLQQRTGNRVWASENGQQNISGTGAWIRIGGSASAYNPTIGTDYTQNSGFIQGGYDRTINASSEGHIVVGAFGTFSGSNSQMQLTNDPGSLTSQTATVRTDGYGLGANLTWLGTNGTYLDGLVQANWYNSDLTSTDWTQSIIGNQGFGDAFSLEGGKRINLNKSWAVVPQAQLVYSSVSFDGITDSNGVSTTLQDGTSLLGRIGARLEWFPNKSVVLHQTQAYVIANLSREFENATKVDVAGTSLEQGNDAMWGELGAGFTYSMTEQCKLFVEGSYNTSLAHPGDSYIAKGVVGVNATF